MTITNVVLKPAKTLCYHPLHFKVAFIIRMLIYVVAFLVFGMYCAWKGLISI